MTTIQPTAPDKLWTPANIVTLIRICLVPVFVLAILSPWPEWVGLPGITMEAKCVIAAGIFILISCTDWIDGYLARSRGEVTDFGKFMDPLADKLLVMSAMAWFVQAGWMAAWAFFIVIARELAVTGLRLVAVEQGRVIAAAKSGKVKTASTMVCICLMLLLSNAATLRLVCVWIILLTTIYSGVEYFIKNRDVLANGEM